MDASIKESVKASDKEAQYDEKAKKLLGHKIILAYILVNTVEEFQGMNPEDVVKYIEGEPYISTVPLDPGMTNTKERKEGSIKETETPEQVIGLNTENSELNEGIAETIGKMYRKGYEAEQISDILDMEVEKVREIIENE